MVDYDPSIINREFERTDPVRVDPERVRRFCEVTGETNPLYIDEAAAKRGPHGGLVAPPSYAVTFRNGRNFFEQIPRLG